MPHWQPRPSARSREWTTRISAIRSFQTEKGFSRYCRGNQKRNGLNSGFLAKPTLYVQIIMLYCRNGIAFMKMSWSKKLRKLLRSFCFRLFLSHIVHYGVYDTLICFRHSSRKGFCQFFHLLPFCLGWGLLYGLYGSPLGTFLAECPWTSFPSLILQIPSSRTITVISTLEDLGLNKILHIVCAQ